MPKTDKPQPEEMITEEKPKPKTKRLTMKAVWTEVDALKQGLAALDVKVAGLGQMVEGLGPKIESLKTQPAAEPHGAQQLSSLSVGVQSLNGNYLRQVEELSSLRKSLSDLGSKVDSLAAGTKLVEESCGAISMEVDGLKESVDKASKKADAIEVAFSKLEGNLRRSNWITGLVIGAIVIVAVVAVALLL